MTKNAAEICRYFAPLVDKGRRLLENEEAATEDEEEQEEAEVN